MMLPVCGLGCDGRPSQRRPVIRCPIIGHRRPRGIIPCRIIRQRRHQRAGSSSSSTTAWSSCVLALDDGAFARLCIGATAVAPRLRRRWLARIAKELEGHPPSATARRLRRYQARRHNGQKCYRLTLDEIDTEELLLAAGTLSPLERDDHGKVEAALARFLSLCILDHRNAFQLDQEMYDSVRIGLCLSALRKGSDGSPKRFRK